MKRLVVSLLMIFLVIGVGVASVAAESQLYKNQFEVIVKIPEFARVVVPEVFYLGEVILDKNMQNQSADPITEFFLLTNTDVYVNFESSGFDFGDNAVEGAPNLAGYRWKDAEDKWWYFASGSMGNSFGKKSLWHWTGDVIKIEFGANIAEAISRDIFFMIRSGGYRDVVKVTVFSAK